METTPQTQHHEVLIIGAGTAGITVAAQLLDAENPPDVALLDAAEKHYYQPLWTLVGAGVVEREETERDMADYIPWGATWIQDAAARFDPDANTVVTEQGHALTYDYLVVCPGIQLDWDAVPGMKEALGTNGVCSNYAYDTCAYTWEAIQAVAEKPGPVRALFSQPAGAIKCGGAPQKIMYLAADHFRRTGKLAEAEIHFFTPGSVIFGVKKFAKTLDRVLDRYGIAPHFFHELVEVRGDAREAVFRTTGGDGAPTERVEPFDLLHVVPPQHAPDMVRESPLANDAGYVEVDKHTLQHVRYANVFGLGDASSLPTAKTGAAVRKQAPVVTHNLLQLRRTGALAQPKTYHGYSSCPLITGYGKLVLAEFDYDNEPDPSFPFDTSQERYSMYLLKKDVLPQLYWHGMLKGRA